MRAMILAAGRGTRMGHLTDSVPKPLLPIGDHYLIEHIILNLKKANISDIVINVAYKGEQIKKALGNGSRYNVQLAFSEEKEPGLETGGGILKALPLLGNSPFLVISGDIITDYPFSQLPTIPLGLAHLVMVNNPSFHPEGDFVLYENGILRREKKSALTFANIGIYHPSLFAQHSVGRFPLIDLLIPAAQQGTLTGEHYQGKWFNITTPTELLLACEHSKESLNSETHFSEN